MYQQKFIQSSGQELVARLSSEELIVPASDGINFDTYFYKNGLLRSSFSGKKIRYFNDGSFQAEGDLIYKEYDKNLKPVIAIKTEKGFGEFESGGKSKNSFFSGNKHIKFIILPEEVGFTYQNNVGKTRNIYVDAIKRTISSKNKIESNGPMGHLSGKGFFYDVNKEEFKINSDVSGQYKSNNHRE